MNWFEHQNVTIFLPHRLFPTLCCHVAVMNMYIMNTHNTAIESYVKILEQLEMFVYWSEIYTGRTMHQTGLSRTNWRLANYGFHDHMVIVILASWEEHGWRIMISEKKNQICLCLRVICIYYCVICYILYCPYISCYSGTFTLLRLSCKDVMWADIRYWRKTNKLYINITQSVLTREDWRYYFTQVRNLVTGFVRGFLVTRHENNYNH